MCLIIKECPEEIFIKLTCLAETLSIYWKATKKSLRANKSKSLNRVNKFKGSKQSKQNHLMLPISDGHESKFC